jgi:hypothetical protein
LIKLVSLVLFDSLLMHLAVEWTTLKTCGNLGAFF